MLITRIAVQTRIHGRIDLVPISSKFCDSHPFSEIVSETMLVGERHMAA